MKIKKKEKKNKVPTYNVTSAQLEQMKAEAYQKGVQTTIDLSVAVPMMVLRDHFGFGRKRLEDFATYYSDMFDSVGLGYLSLMDMVKTLNKETGIVIKMKE